jgi:MFS family permease
MTNPTAVRSGAASSIGVYPYYALGVLVVTNILNCVDRYIVSILAGSIQRDLGVTDAQLGFLMGTAFAVFYAVVGIAMGRIADGVSRPRLMAAGLTVWSIMTALGGAATSFVSLSLCRIGVGVGEATGTPCSQALLAEYFPPRHRAMALSAFLVGSFAGSALAMIVGGMFIQHWTDSMCQAVPIAGACDLPGWKAALIAVGLPGIPLALFVATLREPPRERTTQSIPRLFARELGSSLPPFTLLSIYRVGGAAALRANVVLLAAIAGTAAALIALTGDLSQWLAIGLGAYCISSWAQIQRHRDRPLFQLTFGCRTFSYSLVGSALVACVGGAVSAWAAPYAMRNLALPAAEAGVSLGLTNALCAGAGILMGGFLTDRLKSRDPRAPIWITMVSLFGSVPGLLIMGTTTDKQTFIAGYMLFSFLNSAWGGSIAALVQDLVLPRMRSSAASAFALVTIVISSGVGPYWIGKVSMLSGSLGMGLMSVLALAPVAFVLLVAAAKRLKHESSQGRQARADAAGEGSFGDSRLVPAE